MIAERIAAALGVAAFLAIAALSIWTAIKTLRGPTDSGGGWDNYGDGE